VALRVRLLTRLIRLKGTAFRPYIKSVISRALAPEGTFSSSVGGPQRLKPIHLGT
jgi:hypothetical protein